jgi:2'-5' RNA ligase
VRLFVALTPPATVLADVDAALGPARTLQPDLRWIPVERWHLTLAFYGEVPDESLAGVVAMVERKLSRRPLSGPVELRFSGSGQFSRRALWVGVDGDVDGLRALAKSVNTDRRPYRAHLTVARLRGGQDATRAAEVLSSYAGPLWTADAVHLVRSFLGPKPRYEIVGSWPVTASATDS